MSPGAVEAIASISVLTHFNSLMRGVVELRDVVYFASGICALMVATTFVVDWRKSA
jgi:ABC-2 type transport system permease protein